MGRARSDGGLQDRALHYGLGRAGKSDERCRWLQPPQNLRPCKAWLELSARTAQHLLADCLMQRRLICSISMSLAARALVPLAKALEFGGVLYLAGTDGRSPWP